MRKRAFPKAAFYALSFLSSLGDALLYFGLPAGIGVERNDLRFSVVIFLVPAVFMFLSSFLAPLIRARVMTARADYARILLLVGSIEVGLGLGSLHFDSPPLKLILVLGFIAVYATLKEGIPRLLYVQSIYDYFFEPQDSSKAIAMNQALGIVAWVSGVLISGQLALAGQWESILLFDALTFVGLGLVILYLGKDPAEHAASRPYENTTGVTESALAPSEHRRLKLVRINSFAIVLMTSMFWPYLPIISARAFQIDFTTSFALIAFLRAPGLIGTFFSHRIRRPAWIDATLLGTPLLYSVAILLFFIAPSTLSQAAMILVSGLWAGLYYPVEQRTRRQLPSHQLIHFNQSTLRLFALAQLFGTCGTLALLSNPEDISMLVTVITVISSLALLLYLILGFRFRLVGAALPLVLMGCTWNSTGHEVKAVLPEFSNDLTLKPVMTYAKTVILNDTSAKLLEFGSNLKFTPKAIKQLKWDAASNTMTLDLDASYRSALDEDITADDVEHSFKYLISRKDLSISNDLITALEGKVKCEDYLNCSLPSISKVKSDQISIRTKVSLARFKDILSSFSFVLLKKNRPPEISVGECRLPYPTGSARISSCTKHSIQLTSASGQVTLLNPAVLQNDTTGNYARVTSENPGTSVYATLSHLAIYFSPHSSKLSRVDDRCEISAHLSSYEIASALRLRPASQLSPEGLRAYVLPKEHKVEACGKNRRNHLKGSVIKIGIDPSVPHIPKIKNILQASLSGLQIKSEFRISSNYPADFDRNDLWVGWFTPAFLSSYDLLSVFDCSPGAPCFFNWSSKELQSSLNQLRKEFFSGRESTESIARIERTVRDQYYAIPVAQMNWWIQQGSTFTPIHPGGLTKLKATDFLNLR